MAMPGCGPSPAEKSNAGVQVSQDALMQWGDLLGQPRPVPDETISYGDDPLQVVDIWIPKGDLPLRGVIMIHGGCWQSNSAGRDVMNYIANDLREAGIGVWNIEYRGVDRVGGGYPGTYEDVGKAADLFAEKGADFGFSTRKTVVIGHSAGGHLALWLAARPQLPRGVKIRGSSPISIDIAISQGGLPDLRQGVRRKGHVCGTEAPTKMAGGHFRWTSPPDMPIGEAKQILFNNARDEIAPPAFADNYKASLASEGVPLETVITPDEGHVELIAPGSKSWAAQKLVILEVLTLE
jgi:pimeloyl-ACP methyl ester carboxylesterase